MSSFQFFLLIFGTAMVVSPLFLTREFLRFRRRTASTFGTVVTQSEQTHMTGPHRGTRIRTDHAVVAFVVDGQDHTCVSSAGATWTIHPEGSRVQVRYDPEDPSNADVDHGSWDELLHYGPTFGFPPVGAIMLLYLYLTSG